MSWAKTRLKYLCTDSGRYGLNVPADQYSAAGTRLIRTSDISEMGTLKPEEDGVYVDQAVEERHRLQQGDLLLSRSGTLGRSFLVPNDGGGATYAGFLVKFRPRSDVEPRFLSYASISSHFQGTIRSEAVLSTIQNFNAERYANIPLMAPGLKEQCRIADFLDAETARVDRLAKLAATARNLLLDRRLALIDSRLPGGTVTRLKYLSKIVDTEHKTAPHVPGGGYWIAGTAAIKSGHMARDLLYETSVDAYSDWTRRAVPRPGDLLLTREAPVGEVAMISDADPLIAIGQRMVLIRPNDSQLDGKFLLWTLLSNRTKLFIDDVTQGSLHPHLNMSEIGNVPIPVIPIVQQQEIAGDISRNIAAIAEIANVYTRMLDLLAERRQALITAAVTGQFDVSTACGEESQ